MSFAAGKLTAAAPMDGSSDHPSFVLHCDVDAFFVQVEQLKDPSLQASVVLKEGPACMCAC